MTRKRRSSMKTLHTIIGGIGMAIVMTIGMYGTVFFLSVLSEVLR